MSDVRPQVIVRVKNEGPKEWTPPSRLPVPGEAIAIEAKTYLVLGVLHGADQAHTAELYCRPIDGTDYLTERGWA